MQLKRYEKKVRSAALAMVVVSSVLQGVVPGLSLAAVTTNQQAETSIGVYGQGPFSGYPWFTGNWVNGNNDHMAVFENYRDMKSDVVTQSVVGMRDWFQQAGADSEAQFQAEMAQTKENFQPSFDGIFKNQGWKAHIWGPAAVEHRKRLIHLCWMDALPKNNGNQSGNNSKVWYDVMNGSGDAYLFLLGRKFAYLDEQYGDTEYPMTIDLGYEFTLVSHPDYPGGYYTNPVTGQSEPAYLAFRAGWARMVKAFKEGYSYQRGTPNNYRFSWRPQTYTTVKDNEGKPVPLTSMFPNDAADYEVPTDVVMNGITIMPQGKLGKQVDLIGVSWHDAVDPQVKGGNIMEPGNNWAFHLQGNDTIWGLDQMAAFARAQNVKMVFPEWSARGWTDPKLSPNPGDTYRFIHYFFKKNQDVLAYESVFDMGVGELKRGPWQPAQTPEQDPTLVYPSLWRKPGAPDQAPPFTKAFLTGTQTNGWYTADTRVTLSPLYEFPEVAKTEYSVDGGVNWLTYGGPLAVAIDGDIDFRYRSTDAANNVEAPKSLTFRLDQSGPTVAFMGLRTYSVTESVYVSYTAADSLSGLKDPAGAGSLLSSPAYLMSPGVHEVSVTASDNAGNVTAATGQFSIAADYDSLSQLVGMFLDSSDKPLIKLYAASLKATLRIAKEADARGFAQVKAWTIEAFIQEVSAQKGKALTNEQADSLIAFGRTL